MHCCSAHKNFDKKDDHQLGVVQNLRLLKKPKGKKKIQLITIYEFK